MQLAEIIVDIRGEPGNQTYTYLVPPEWQERLQPGMGVLVPFGGREVVGIVHRVYPAEEADPSFTLKPVETVLEQPLLNEHLMMLVHFLQRETLCPVAEAVHTVLPAVARIRLRTMVELIAQPTGLRSPVHQQVADAIQQAGGTLSLHALKARFASANLQSALSALRRKGFVRSYVELGSPPHTSRQRATVRLIASPEGLEAFFQNEGKRRPSQTALLVRLALHPEGVMPVQTLLEETGASPTTLRQLESTGLIRREVPDEAGLLELLPTSGAQPPFTLTWHQQGVVQAIRDTLREGGFHTFLLFGITASGKTEVYLRAAAECLRLGRSVLFLVPEIALTAQLTGAFRARFGNAVAVLHSQLDETERFDQWLRVRSGERAIVVGARSAVFAPLQNIGLIVLDEEHEPAYKQQSMPRYHARQVAEARARQENAVLLLGSATPALESFYATQSGNYTLLLLPERVGGVELPEVGLIDLRTERGGILSRPLFQAIRETLQDGKQVILFLNRRAFAPFLLCRECGHVPLCPNCSVSLAFHITPRELRCHHCDYRTVAPTTCPHCKGVGIAPHGVGTQRVEQTLQKLLPEAIIARLDRDVLTRRDLYLETLRRFRAGETQILIGTQMVAKGLDFPNVQLVGVVNADTALYLPDFRAGERTFQLLTQVAGRAGRREERGRVLVQTYNPDHPAIQHARTHDYSAFYDWELAQRRELLYPPFTRLANVLAQHPNPDLPRHALEHFKQQLSSLLPLSHSPILGPSPAPLSRLRGEYRYHLLLRLPPNASPSDLLREALQTLSPEHRALLQVDIDPISLL